MKRFLFMLLACLVISVAGTSTASASTFDSLYKSASSYLGVPYKYGGTTSSGFDCSGFTQAVFKNNGISIPRTTGQQYATGQAVSKSNLQAGDLVFFKTGKSGVSHVGIYIGSNNFIHASTSKGVMISSINDPYYWGSRYVGAKRVKDFSAPPKVVQKPAAPKPDPYPSRVDIAVTLSEKLGLSATGNTSIFKDISNNHPEISSIAAVAEAGIFTGNNGAFMPEGKLTRAQLAKVLVEAFGLEGRTATNFNDVPNNHWATEYIEILYHNNITTGYLNGDFGLNDYVTKGQFQKFIDRIK
ncbi:endopeptidase Spr precursor [Sporosarcina ureilytica]|uniref:Endopeptidase Spr n=2 Tax=Sporosarcina ureilytica TaxID=298596 RepID=A0A1D8JKR2_9BACL|nr:endopeptidase Spr precursor [Sporosarcina ureilytica]